MNFYSTIIALRQTILHRTHFWFLMVATGLALKSILWWPMLPTAPTITSPASALKSRASQTSSSPAIADFEPPYVQSTHSLENRTNEDSNKLKEEESQKEYQQQQLKSQTNIIIPTERQVEQHDPITENTKTHFSTTTENFFQRQATETDPPYAIFYNVYMPPDGGQENVDNAISIVREQIQKVQTSYATNKYGTSKIVPMYYNTIGKPDALSNSYVQELCENTTVQTAKPARPLRCQHLQHYLEGHEHVTLQRLYEYCHEFPDNQVTYIHTKGSFHIDPEHKNDFWRQRLTSAATHQYCVDPPDKTCNVCSLHFYPMWAPFFPGNFWTAQCSYVKKLLPPINFDKTMDKVAKRILELVESEQLGFSFYNDTLGDKLCLDRYSAECWVGSHPDLIPCEIADNVNIKMWRKVTRAHEPFRFQMSPQNPLHGSWISLDQKQKKIVARQPSLRQREYFLLPGNIIKWYMLYDKLPGNDSWVWKWFPDSAFWRDNIKKYGPKAVDIVTANILKRNKGSSASARDPKK